MGQGRHPSRSRAFSRRMPVVVSSQPPRRQSPYSAQSPPMRLMRSPPSSMRMWGWHFRVSRRRFSYPAISTPWMPKVSTPREAIPAATSSWVERGLQPVRYTSAPPFFSTRARFAVLASRWTETATRFPAKGFSRWNRASMPERAGMKSRTQLIFSLPASARDGSRMMLISLSFSRKNAPSIRRGAFCLFCRLISRHPSELAPCRETHAGCRGFTGPVPPPLWIRGFSCLSVSICKPSFLVNTPLTVFFPRLIMAAYFENDFHFQF